MNTASKTELSFEERVVIVSGGGQGLGRSHALAFAARGASVVVNDLGSSPRGDGGDASHAAALVAEIEAAGGRAIANTDSVEDGERIVECALDTFGRVDVVVNNAGILRDAAFHNLREEDWDKVYRVHLLGAFKLTRAAWPHMREQGYGRVLMTTSAAGIYGNFGQANYAAAKLGLHGLSQSLAAEGARRNIHVNTIAPVAASRLTEAVLAPAQLAVLDPVRVTPLALWLTHQDCAINGALFEVGGGWIARLRWERAKGARFAGNFSPEELRDAWGDVEDFADADRPTSMMDAFGPISAASGASFAPTGEA